MSFFGIWCAGYVVNRRHEAVLQRTLSLSAAQQQVSEARLAALRYQINPHFLFNTLSSISTLVLCLVRMTKPTRCLFGLPHSLGRPFRWTFTMIFHWPRSSACRRFIWRSNPFDIPMICITGLKSKMMPCVQWSQACFCSRWSKTPRTRHAPRGRLPSPRDQRRSSGPEFGDHGCRRWQGLVPFQLRYRRRPPNVAGKRLALGFGIIFADHEVRGVGGYTVALVLPWQDPPRHRLEEVKSDVANFVELRSAGSGRVARRPSSLSAILAACLPARNSLPPESISRRTACSERREA